jgi:hypothetical protein
VRFYVCSGMHAYRQGRRVSIKSAIPLLLGNTALVEK